MEPRENVMGTKPVFPLLMSMSIPPMISMLIQSMYNVVDSIFVARISEKALTAVSLAYPLQNLILAVAVGYGVGINACIAKSLGARKQEETNREAAHGILFTLLHSILFVLIGLFLTKPFLGFFTSDPETFSMGCSYTYIVVCLSFGSIFHIYIEKMFQATGNMIMPMILQAAGALTNIILDPIMIFGLFGFPAMGVAGAAIATVAGQMLACGLAVLLFIKKEKQIHISFKGFQFDKAVAVKIYSIGIPSCIMLSLPSLLVGILNCSFNQLFFSGCGCLRAVLQISELCLHAGERDYPGNASDYELQLRSRISEKNEGNGNLQHDLLRRDFSGGNGSVPGGSRPDYGDVRSGRGNA